MFNDFIKQVLHHKKGLSQEEKDCFAEIYNPKGKLVLVPIYANGQERFGVARVELVSQGTKAKILAILASSDDKILISSGEEVPLVSSGHKEADEEMKKFLS